MPSPAARPPIAVLDTNVVLDWLVFGNPASDAFAAAIAGGRIRWIGTPAMRAELAHVLERGHLDGWAPDTSALWATWARHCTEQAPPAPTGPRGRLRCSDPDDQMFIDLAVAAGARWLLSRDRAVLKLARALRAHGVEAIVPERWQPPE